jgi:hypothetical protein
MRAFDERGRAVLIKILGLVQDERRSRKAGAPCVRAEGEVHARGAGECSENKEKEARRRTEE